MKTLIAYSSLTGNTKKVCESVRKVFTDVEMEEVSKVSNIDDYDFIIVGTWIDKGTADIKAMKFINNLKNKKVAFIFTLGAYPDSKHAMDCIEKITKLFVDNGNEVVGYYHCQGAIDPRLIEMMKTKFGPEHPHGPNPERIKRWEDASKHPDENDLESAYKYFKELVTKL